MTMQRQWIQSITGAVDPGTGALLVQTVGQAILNALGATGATLANVSYVPIAATAGTPVTVLAGVAGQSCYLLSLVGTMSADGTLQVTDDVTPTPNNLSGAMNLAANGGLAIQSPFGIAKSAAGAGLVLSAVGGNFNGVAVVLQA